MPSNQAHPVGASGKDPIVPGTMPNQAPCPIPNPIPGPIPAPNGVEAMNMLIKTVILNNSHVRKLNALRRMWRSDPDEASAILDYEDESPVPMLGTFMDIWSALRHLASNNTTPGFSFPTWAPDWDVFPIDAVLNPANSDLDHGVPRNPGW